MEISTKERYFYISTLPLMIAGLLFMLFYYAPWANPNEICDKTKIISKPLKDNYSKSTFKLGEPIRLSLESDFKIESCYWYFGKVDADIITGNKKRQNTTIAYNNVGETIIEARLNGACNIGPFAIDIINSCEDGIKNYDETGIDCGGIICDKCEIVKEARKRKPLVKKDKYIIEVENNNMICGTSYGFTCINKSKGNRVEPDVIWIFDQVDTPISGNPSTMIFESKQNFVEHRIAAFKNGKFLTTKTITVKCDNI